MLHSSTFRKELFPANSKEEVEIDGGIESVYQEVNTEEEIDKVNLLSFHQHSSADTSLQSNSTGIDGLKKIKNHLNIWIIDYITMG